MITVVGSLNMDLLIDSPRLPAPGETVRGENFRRAAGGKGANQACAVARMGGRCTMLGAVGDDSFGEELLAGLRGDGVDVSAVRRVPSVPTGVALITIDAAGQNQIVIASGANGAFSVDDISRHAGLLRAARAVVVQLEIPLPAVEAAIRLGREGGALTVLNPAPALPVGDELLRLCDWIIPNEIEAGQISGISVHTRDDARLAAQRLHQRSGGRGVVVTLGADGVWLETSEFSGHVPGFPVEAVDTVAAGDTLVGAFVSEVVQGVAPVDAARFACAAAAIAVTRSGALASVPRRHEVEAWLHGR